MGGEGKCCFQANHFLGLHMKGIPLWPLSSVVEHIDLPFLAAKWNKNVQSENLSRVGM